MSSKVAYVNRRSRSHSEHDSRSKQHVMIDSENLQHFDVTRHEVDSRGNRASTDRGTYFRSANRRHPTQRHSSAPNTRRRTQLAVVVKRSSEYLGIEDHDAARVSLQDGSKYHPSPTSTRYQLHQRSSRRTAEVRNSKISSTQTGNGSCSSWDAFVQHVRSIPSNDFQFRLAKSTLAGSEQFRLIRDELLMMEKLESENTESSNTDDDLASSNYGNRVRQANGVISQAGALKSSMNTGMTTSAIRKRIEGSRRQVTLQSSPSSLVSWIDDVDRQRQQSTNVSSCTVSTITRGVTPPGRHSGRASSASHGRSTILSKKDSQRTAKNL